MPNLQLFDDGLLLTVSNRSDTILVPTDVLSNLPPTRRHSARALPCAGAAGDAAAAKRDGIELEDLCENEVRWAKAQPGLNGSREQYEACARVLIDLARLRWRVQEDRFGFELVSPRGGGFTPQQAEEYKAVVRAELGPQLATQFAEISVAKIHPADGKAVRQSRAASRSRCSLLTDGSCGRGCWMQWKPAVRSVSRGFTSAVQPYLQL